MKKWLKILLYTIGGILLIPLLVIVFLLTPWGKETVRKQAEEYLNNKLKTEVIIGKIDYSIPRKVALYDFLVRDIQRDTLAAIQTLEIEMDMFALLKNKISVSNLFLEGVSANLYRSESDNDFNYNFIIEAFAENEEVVIQDIEEKELDTTASVPLIFDIVKVQVKDIRFLMDDKAAGTYFALQLSELLLRPKKIQPDSMLFELRELQLSGLKSIFTTDTSYLSPTPEDTSVASDFKLSVDKIQIQESGFTFHNRMDSMYFNTFTNLLGIDSVRFALLDQDITLHQLYIENTAVSIAMGQNKAGDVEEMRKQEALEDDGANGWRIKADNLSFKNITYLMDDNNVRPQRSGVDYAHLNVQQINLNADGILYSIDSIAANLKHLSLKEKSGLHLMTLKTKFLYHSKGAILADLFLQTPQTIIRDHIEVGYPSLAALENEIQKLHLDMKLEQTTLGIDDILLFMPKEQQDILLPYRGQQLQLNTHLKGYLAALQIPHLKLNGLDATEIALKGEIKGLPDGDKLYYDLEIEHIKTTYQDIASFLPDSLKMKMNLPEWYQISGLLTGTTSIYQPDLQIITSDGHLSVCGEVYIPADTATAEKYDLALMADQLNIGKILRQDSSLGKINLAADVRGTSFDIGKMEAEINTNVQSAWLMGYDYTQIDFAAKIKEETGYFVGKANDPNVRLGLSGSVDLSKEYPAVEAVMRIANVDFNALKFTEDSIRFSGDFFVDFLSLNPDYPLGKLSISDPELSLNGLKLPLDSIVVDAEPMADSTLQMVINLSNVLHAKLVGKIPLTQIGNAVIQHVDRHYSLSSEQVVENDSSDIILAKDYNMAMGATISYHPLLRRWLPALQPFDTIDLIAKMNEDSMQVNVFIPQLKYDNYLIDSGYVDIQSDKRSLLYRLGMNKLNYDAISAWYPSVFGTIVNDSLKAALQILDSSKNNQFYLAALMRQQKDSSIHTMLSLSEGLRFNYNLWNVDAKNVIAFGKDGFFIRDLDINNQKQHLKLYSETANFGTPLNIDIRNFYLSNLTSMISEGDTLLADGILNVNANIDLYASDLVLEAEAAIDGLQLLGGEIGNVFLSAKNESTNTLDASLILRGQGNDLLLGGKYYLTPLDGNDFSFNLGIQNLNLKSLESATFGNLTNSSGSVYGDLLIKGTAERPTILGELKTKQLQTTIRMLNSSFLFPDEMIVFSERGVALDNFTIEDANKQKAVINGTVRTRDFSSYFLNIDLNANKWMVANSTKKDNDFFYGKMLLSTQLNVKGMANAPNVTGSLTIHDSTKLTIAILDDGPGMIESEGIVVFKDGRFPAYDESEDVRRPTNRSRFSRNTEMNVNVAIEKNAVFNVLMDMASGEELEVRGEAALNTQLNPDGSIGLAGTYELMDGYYHLNFDLIKKRFRIKSGSVITFAGDPMDAEVDIVAVYDAVAAPFDLVEKLISDPAQLVYYKQRLPFEVHLKLKGKALKPEIVFDVILPEDKATLVGGDVANTVQSRLNNLRTNQSEVNKQVFALLVLNRFVSEDPFSSGGTDGFEFAARQSVSRFLSNQLNQIAGQLVRGLELNMDLNTAEDYSTGSKVNRTDLNISASKNLFDDRVMVTVGNDFMLEGQAAQRQQSSLIPGNLAIDYRITQDGRYLARAYRKNELQNLIDGYVVETGVGIRMHLEYTRFRYLFMNREKMRQRWLKQTEVEENKNKQKK